MGKDVLISGDGTDTLIGGLGKDTYHVGVTANSIDTTGLTANSLWIA